MVFRMSQYASYDVLDRLTRPTSPIQLPSPPFVSRGPGPVTHTLGQAVHATVLESFPFWTSSTVTVAVIVAWTMLWTSGRWRPERSWLDRAGRLLGWYWIGLGILVGVLSEIWKFLV
jgi:hypothetical protein